MAMSNGLLCRTRQLGVVMLWALLVLASAVRAAASVGEVTLSIGVSQIERSGRSEAVAKGDGIVPGDVVRTSANGHVHIRFVDGARVSVRPESVLQVVEYRYDAADPSASLIKFHLETGTVRGISGVAAQAARDRFRLNTPLVAIGVKGTDFVTQATAKSAVVLVNQGAIVLAPLDGSCLAEGFGSCGTPRSRELASHMSGLALVYRQAAPEPVLLPVSSLKGADRIVPKIPNERVDRSGALVADAIDGPRSASTVAESRTLDRVANEAVRDSQSLLRPVVVPPAVAAPAEDLVPAVKVLPPPSSLTWGRWAGNSVPGDNLTVPFAQALSGGQVTVGDDYYVLIRKENVANLLSSANGVADFRLQRGVASYREWSNAVSAATIDGGSLSIDFGRNTFSTSLAVTSPVVGAQAVAATGSIDRSSGIFRSGIGQNARVAGAVSLDVSQAGYFFSKTVGNGALSGATLWSR